MAVHISDATPTRDSGDAAACTAWRPWPARLAYSTIQLRHAAAQQLRRRGQAVLPSPGCRANSLPLTSVATPHRLSPTSRRSGPHPLAPPRLPEPPPCDETTPSATTKHSPATSPSTPSRAWLPTSSRPAEPQACCEPWLRSARSTEPPTTTSPSSARTTPTPPRPSRKTCTVCNRSEPSTSCELLRAPSTPPAAPTPTSAASQRPRARRRARPLPLQPSAPRAQQQPQRRNLRAAASLNADGSNRSATPMCRPRCAATAEPPSPASARNRRRRAGTRPGSRTRARRRRHRQDSRRVPANRAPRPRAQRRCAPAYTQRNHRCDPQQAVDDLDALTDGSENAFQQIQRMINEQATKSKMFPVSTKTATCGLT